MDSVWTLSHPGPISIERMSDRFPFGVIRFTILQLCLIRTIASYSSDASTIPFTGKPSREIPLYLYRFSPISSPLLFPCACPILSCIKTQGKCQASDKYWSSTTGNHPFDHVSFWLPYTENAFLSRRKPSKGSKGISFLSTTNHVASTT